MLVFKENFNQTFPIFKDTVDKASFVSFDCEMTGVTLEPKTDGTKYDTQQFRYYKTREVIKKFELIQLGFTFYIPHTREAEKEEIYIERTFTFYLFKNSKLRALNKDIFNNEMICHPATMKFLNENHFDFNVLIQKGIPYNKLEYKEQIKSLIQKEKFLIANSAFFLSKENEGDLINGIIKITDFLLTNGESSNKSNKKPSMAITFKNPQTMIYLLGCNLKKIIYLTNFTITKDKKTPNTVIVEKSKKPIPQDDFKKYYTSFENFKQIIENDPNLIYQSRFQVAITPTVDNINDLVNEELGFSLYLEYLIQKKIPIIGHNIYFDIMFIFDKLINDLPEDFYTFKSKVHELFPYIYDTKAISTKLGKYENTKLENLYKHMQKNNFTSYVPFCADVTNGFCLYHDLENSMLHDAGFDSVITGRCFVLMIKALENDYYVENMKKIVHNIGNKVINQEKEIKIKHGWVDLKQFDAYINFSIMSLVDCEVLWDCDKQNREMFEKEEKSLIDSKYKAVFHVKCKEEKFDYMVSIYDIAKLFENENYDISVVKNDYYSAFVEFVCDYEKKKEDVMKLVETIKGEEKIEKVIRVKEFYEDVKKEISFDII